MKTKQAIERAQIPDLEQAGLKFSPLKSDHYRKKIHRQTKNQFKKV